MCKAGGPPIPPHYMDECPATAGRQNKGDRKWAICKWLKTLGQLEFGGPGKKRMAPPPPYGFCKDVIRWGLEGGGLLRM